MIESKDKTQYLQWKWCNSYLSQGYGVALGVLFDTRLTPFLLIMERNLNDVLGNAFYAQEQEEAKSRQIEDLIKSYEGASALLPEHLI